MDAEFKNKKEVVFDGKNLIFNVDGIEIKNGKLPDSFSVKERYEISAESISMLVVALGDGNTLAEFTDVQEGFSFSRKTRAIYSLKDEYVKKLVEEITRLENKANSLQEKVYEERRKASDEEYKRYLLENLIKEHNKR
ncbi:hypothetical protein, partial [Bacteroides uniformis]